MDFIPVSRRTRLQKSLNNGKSGNLRKRRENYNGGSWVSNNGVALSDDDDDECVMIDESEFLEVKCERISSKKVGVEEKTSNVGRFNDGDGYGYDDGDDDDDGSLRGFGHNNGKLGLNDGGIKGKRIMDDNGSYSVHVDDSDDDDESFMGFGDNNEKLTLDDNGSNSTHIDDNDDDHGERFMGSGKLTLDDNGSNSIHINDNDDDHDESFMGFGDKNGKLTLDGEEINGKRIMDDDGNNGIHIDADVDDDDDHGESFMGFGADNGKLTLDGKEIKGKRIMDDNGTNGIHINDNDDVHDHGDGGGGDGGIGGDGGGERKRKDETKIEFQRRLFEGMVLPRYPNKNFEDSNNFIGTRTRSHYYKPKFPRKNIQDGTLKCPITIDLESTSSSSSSDDDDGEVELRPETRKGTGGKPKRGRKRGRKPLKKAEKEEEEQNVDLGALSQRNKYIVKRVKASDVHNILLNVIMGKGDERVENVVASISYKFSFGVENLKQENSQMDDDESECLFKEMDFALGIHDIGEEATCLRSNGDEFDVDCDSAIWHEKLCGEGKHYWINDEEIGILCKFCSFVNLEIRHITPGFYKDPFGPREENRSYGLLPNNYTHRDSKGFHFIDDIVYDSRGDDPSSVDDTRGTVWDLIPGTEKTLYPHQREGFECIWRNVSGRLRLDELSTKLSDQSGAGGCLICHAPGTGKTRLATVFLMSFMKLYPTAKPVIIAPCPVLRTWEDEFAKWNPDLPFFNLNDKEFSDVEYHELLKFFPKKKLKIKDEKTVRMGKIAAWSRGKSCVLAISYELFQRLAGYGEGIHHEKVRQILLKYPDILVMDEGHRPRKHNSKSWQVLSEVFTKRRVILSGTPFQNNFEEFYNTISLVRPDFVRFCSSHLSNNRTIEKVRKEIKDFVHVHEGEILSKTLQGLYRSLVVLRPSDLQKRFFSTIRRCKFIKYDNLISVSSVHPSIFCDEEEVGYSLVDEELKTLLKRHKSDPKAGVKTRFLVELIKLCEGERILVFGQYLSPLNFIEDLLKSLFQWTKGKEIFYIDGVQDMKERHSSIKLFNDPKSHARVLLASTKACCEGISLVGASRVVLLDVAWNPSVLRQAISRAYRLGQPRNVFVYHLIALGTLEEEKCLIQAEKEHVSDRLFISSSSAQGEDSQKTSVVREIYEDCVLEAMAHHEKAKDMFEKIIFQPKAADLIRSF